MTDSSVPRLLAAQTTASVEAVDLRVVHGGAGAIADALAAARREGAGYVVVDAVDDEDLAEIGRAVVDDPFVAGAAGLAGGVGRARAERGVRAAPASGDAAVVGEVPSIVLAGSCSARTLEQVADFREHQPSLRLDAIETPDADRLAQQALAWYDAQPEGSAPLVYSSMPPAELRRVQDTLGAERASDILETAMGLIARGAVERGVRRVVVAGGETSGAVVTALDVPAGVIGAEVAAGVPWIYTGGAQPIALLLKSGNFGGTDLLTRAVGAESEDE